MSQLEPLHIALWDTEHLRAFAEGLSGRPLGWDLKISFLDRQTCEQQLLAGLVDIAMIPSVEVLSRPDDFSMLPAVAFSSWKSGRARIELAAGLQEKPKQIGFQKEFTQEALMTRIVLKEHYRMEPEFEVDAGQGVRSNAVHVGDNAPAPGETVLDLGQEWFELTNYPMVWGAFTVRPGEGDRRMVDLLRDAVDVWERERGVEADRPEEPFMTSAPRFRLDDIATASLTELADLLYFYKVTEEVPAVAFAKIEEDREVESPDEDDPDAPPTAWLSGQAEA